MPVYRWQSELLAQYAPGNIIVQAESVQHARDLVWGEFENWMIENRDWEVYYRDTGDPESYNYSREKLRKDLEPEPEIVPPVLWIIGSS